MNEFDSSNPEEGTPSSRWKPSTPDELLQSMFYELRTPFLVIKGYAQILTDESRKELHPKAVENILQTTDKIEATSNQMMDDYRGLKQKPGT